eukprot:2371209-Lingulodinium_polyedra.AAC.1
MLRKMRLNRLSVAATARKSYARALHAHARKLARAGSTRACNLQTAAAADGRLDRINARRFTNAAQCCGRID